MNIHTKSCECNEHEMECPGFTPGLVGGHCIVLIHIILLRTEKLGYHSQIILAGRKIMTIWRIL